MGQGTHRARHNRTRAGRSRPKQIPPQRKPSASKRFYQIIYQPACHRPCVVRQLIRAEFLHKTLRVGRFRRAEDARARRVGGPVEHRPKASRPAEGTRLGSSGRDTRRRPLQGPRSVRTPQPARLSQINRDPDPAKRPAAQGLHHPSPPAQTARPTSYSACDHSSNADPCRKRSAYARRVSCCRVAPERRGWCAA